MKVASILPALTKYLWNKTRIIQGLKDERIPHLCCDYALVHRVCVFKVGSVPGSGAVSVFH